MDGYAVVAFDDEGEVSVVPCVWLTENEKACCWPPYRDANKLSKAIKRKSTPQDSWPKHKARVLSKCGKLHFSLKHIMVK